MSFNWVHMWQAFCVLLVSALSMNTGHGFDSCHVDQFTFHISLPSLKFTIFIHLSELYQNSRNLKVVVPLALKTYTPRGHLHGYRSPAKQALHSNNRKFEVERPKRQKDNIHLLTWLLISRGYSSPKKYDKLLVSPGERGEGGKVNV